MIKRRTGLPVRSKIVHAPSRLALRSFLADMIIGVYSLISASRPREAASGAHPVSKARGMNRADPDAN
jgi:hypothetical protein